MRKKDFWLIITAVVAALVLAVGQFASEVIPTGAWGLSFPSAGSAPTGPPAGRNSWNMTPLMWETVRTRSSI